MEETPPANPTSGQDQLMFWSTPEEQGAVGAQSSAHGGARPKGQGNRQYPGDKGSGKPPPGDVVCEACETMQCSLSTTHSIHQCTCCVFEYCCVQCLDVGCRRWLRHFDLQCTCQHEKSPEQLADIYRCHHKELPAYVQRMLQEN